MIGELLVKCLAFIAVIHGLRLVCRRLGPRAGGLVLGLPSSTAIALLLHGQDRGREAAAAMAEASLLGLIAAVVLPLIYARAVRQGWRLPCSVAAAVAGYVGVASGLGYFQPGGAVTSPAIAFAAIGLASLLAGRIAVPRQARGGLARSPRGSAIARTVVPAVYVLLVAIACGSASPSCAGLLSTFPSMSMTVLIVTHLEEGPARASRLAKALPPANLSTAAFLAVFRFGCPALGLGWGTLLSYAAALTSLATLELANRQRGLMRLLRPHLHAHWRPALTSAIPAAWLGARLRHDSRSAPGHLEVHRPPRRKRFAPRLEMLPC